MSEHTMVDGSKKTTSQTPAGKGIVQRKCSKCGIKDEEKKKGILQRSAVRDIPEQEAAAAMKAPQQGTPCTTCAAQPPGNQQPSHKQSRTLDEIGEQLSATSQALDGEPRFFMEDRFGMDFSSVRIHTGQEAHLAARVLRADAFTIGNHIFFAEGQFDPGTTGGKSLLAHELTHVVQQGNATVSLNSPVASSQVEAGLEAEADAMAQRVSGEPSGIYAASRTVTPTRSRPAPVSAPLGFLLRGRWRKPGQGLIDCINECTSNQGFAGTLGGILVGICGVIAVLIAAAATPETGGAGTVPAAIIAAAACAGMALGVPTGIMSRCMWDCRG
jgi:hypothetical protein